MAILNFHVAPKKSGAGRKNKILFLFRGKILKKFIFWNIFKFLVSLGKIVTQNWNKNGTVGQFYFQMTQNVALLTKIVALFGKKIWGVFWHLLVQKRAVYDSELLHTLRLNWNAIWNETASLHFLISLFSLHWCKKYLKIFSKDNFKGLVMTY